MPFFKHFTISLLILSTIGSTLTVPLVYLDFEMRRDYIAEVLCINRTKPITVCGGSCYLELNLAKTSQSSDGTPVNHSNLITFFLQQTGDHQLSDCHQFVRSKGLTLHFEGKPNKFSSTVFQPPKPFA